MPCKMCVNGKPGIEALHLAAAATYFAPHDHARKLDCHSAAMNVIFADQQNFRTLGIACNRRLVIL